MARGCSCKATRPITLAPTASTTLTIAGVIADQSGSGGGGSNAGAGGLAVSGAGTVVLGAVNTYTGITALSGGGTLELQSGASAVNSTVAFGGAATLQFDAIASTVAGITGFSGSTDVLDFTGVTPGNVTLVQSVANTATIDGMVVTGSFGMLSQGSDGVGGAMITAACYRQGTRIATDRGDIPIEALRIGDRARTASGSSRPVVWLGFRSVDLARHARPHAVMPIRVQAAAFGPGQPVRDLWLSPDHAVHVDGVLIPIRYLLNGATVAQEPAAKVTWWHVELDRHDVILAEGLPTESYLDTGNRSAFANGGAAVQAHPDFGRPDPAWAPPSEAGQGRAEALAIWERAACAPLITHGEPVRAARARLLDRTEALGHIQTTDPDLRVLASHRLLPVHVDSEWHEVTVPAGVKTVRLVSRSACPAEFNPDSDDWRRLGVAVRNIRMDDIAVPLDDIRLGSGWLKPEAALRWTDGDAEITVTPGSMMRLLLWKNLQYRMVATACDVESPLKAGAR